MNKIDENPKLAYRPFNDLKQALSLVAGLLSESASAGKTDGLAVINVEFLPRRYMAEKACRDKVVSVHGVARDFPYISLMRPDDDEGRVPGWGIIVYQAKKNLRYAVFCCPDPHDWGHDFRCYVLWKKDEKAFRQHIRDQDVKANRITKAPILQDGVLEEITENTIGFLEKAPELEKLGVRLVRGVMLEGKPGNGKTMVCKWIRKICIEQQINWGNVTSSEIEKWYESGSPLHELFSRHKVTFFDDFDVDMVADNKGRDILTAMDGLDDAHHRIRIFTTNKNLQNVDPAFFRPGRIDASFSLGCPTRDLRRRLVDNIWPLSIRQHINEPGRMAIFLKQTEGFSFAELEAIRGIMAKQRVMSGAEWNQDAAFKEFSESRHKKKRAGFGQ